MSRPSFLFSRELSKRDIAIIQDEWDRHLDLIQTIDLHHNKQLSFQTNTNSLLNDIAGSLNEVNWQLQDMRWTLDEMSWTLKDIYNELQLTNIILRDVVNLLKVSDSSKLKEEYIEKGIQFLHNSRYNPKLSSDAKECFLDAIKVDKRDWFVMQRLGYLYLYAYGKPDRNLIEAERWLNQSIEYSEPLIYTDSLRISNYLLNAFMQTDLSSSQRMKAFTARSYFMLGQIYLILTDKERMYQAFEHAYNLQPETEEYLICLLKVCIAKNDTNNAVDKLRLWVTNYSCYHAEHNKENVPLSEQIKSDQSFYDIVINDVASYRVKVWFIDYLNSFREILAADKDLKAKDDFLNELDNLIEVADASIVKARKKVFNEANELYKVCANTIITESLLHDNLHKVKTLLVKEDYLNNSQALDILLSKEQKSVVDYTVDGFKLQEIRSALTVSLVECIKVENSNLMLKRPKLEDEINKEKASMLKSSVFSAAFLGGSLTACLGGIVGFFKGCNLDELSENWGIVGTTILSFGIVGALIGAVVGIILGISATDR